MPPNMNGMPSSQLPSMASMMNGMGGGNMPPGMMNGMQGMGGQMP